MANWASNEKETRDLREYSPRNLTNDKDFAKDLRNIDSNQTLTVWDKYKAKKQLMRAVFSAKQQEINHHLDSFENYLMARKDVEAKAITLEAQKAIMHLEKDQLELMKNMGLSHSEEITSTLIKAAEMLTLKLEEVRKCHILPELKRMTVSNIRKVWEKTNNRILESVDTYMQELYEREEKRI